MIIKGNDLLIYANGSVVAAARTCRISMDSDLIECAGRGRYKLFLPSLGAWQVSVTSLVTRVSSFFTAPSTAVRLSFAVRDRYGTLLGDRMTGSAFIRKSEVTASVESLIQGQFTFQGNGALERVMDGLRDDDSNDLYDDSNNRLRAPSSIL
jgi:hypothetical protein